MAAPDAEAPPRIEAGIVVRPLQAEEAAERAAALAEVLIDSVMGGASVGFLAPLGHGQALGYWREIAASVARGERTLLVALDRTDDRIVGTVQLVLRQPENQPHRADLVKMLVRMDARRRGVGAALLRTVEDAARAAGKTLLVLDTASPDAERLYARAGWVRVGVIPGYALLPDGSLGATTYFYRRLG